MGRSVRRSVGRFFGWLIGRLVGRLVNWLVAWLVFGWLIGQLVGRLVNWLVDWIFSCLVGRLVGRLVGELFSSLQWLPTIRLGWVSCSLFFLYNVSPSPRKNICCGKTWPKCHFLTYFFLVWVGLGLGSWAVS